MSYRQLDHWTRLGVVEPAVAASGSGTHRRWSEDHAEALRIAAALRELGAGLDVIRAAVADGIDSARRHRGDGLLVVDGDGLVHGLDELPGGIEKGWLVASR